MDYNKKAKYRLVASETLDDLIERINYLAESGYELDKLTTSGTANNDWQGIAIMKLANEQTHINHSESTEQKVLHIADVSVSLRDMDLDKIIIALEKQGWKVDKDFLEKNEEYLQDFANEAKKQALSLLDVSNQRELL